eukprot:TRINITY_DN23975_c0_g1_i1.p1 TRINITY_DN23975_c0_g1~~TRINITY_DN23975_c0_g1_i1.p1  ORF type:complete len:227 (-),score=42.52 TRINITY_DN23975_c0_g1_i1:140-820(-)
MLGTVAFLAYAWYQWKMDEGGWGWVAVQEVFLLWDFISDALMFLETAPEDSTLGGLIAISMAVSVMVDLCSGCSFFGMEDGAEAQRANAAMARARRHELENSNWASWWERGWWESYEDAARRRNATLAEAEERARAATSAAKPQLQKQQRHFMGSFRPVVLIVTEDAPQFCLAIAAAIVVEFNFVTFLSLSLTVIGFAIKAIRIKNNWLDTGLSAGGVAADVMGAV